MISVWKGGFLVANFAKKFEFIVPAEQSEKCNKVNYNNDKGETESDGNGFELYRKLELNIKKFLWA